jgi:CheY-like chemotaxis protein
MPAEKLHLLLADDDDDDCLLFKHSLYELPVATQLSVVSDGEELMDYLLNPENELPDFLFLDLNMPRKNGTECLVEIKQNDRLKNLTVIIFSTCASQPTISHLFTLGAQHYIRKPANFSELTTLIHLAIEGYDATKNMKPSKKEFVLSVH